MLPIKKAFISPKKPGDDQITSHPIRLIRSPLNVIGDRLEQGQLLDWSVNDFVHDNKADFTVLHFSLEHRFVKVSHSDQ